MELFHVVFGREEPHRLLTTSKVTGDTKGGHLFQEAVVRSRELEPKAAITKRAAMMKERPPNVFFVRRNPLMSPPL